MKSMIPCLMLAMFVDCTLTASAADGKPAYGLNMLPVTPEKGSPVLVYLNAGLKDDNWKWLVFHGGLPLDQKKYSTKAGWLKVDELEYGRYTIVGYSDEGGKLANEQTVTFTTYPNPNEAPSPPKEKVEPSNVPKNDPSKPTLTTIERTLRNQPQLLIRTAPHKSDTKSDNSTPQQLPLIAPEALEAATALEAVAKSAIEQKLSLSQIVAKAHKQLAGRNWGVDAKGNDIRQSHLESLERLLKEVALTFEASSVKEDPTNAILALTTVAALLRQDAQSQLDSPRRQNEAPQSTAVRSMPVESVPITTYFVDPNCCGRFRIFQR